MSQPHPMGTMADPDELVAALRAIGAADRMLTTEEAAATEERAGGRELFRLECAQHLAGAVEAQVLMAGGAAADAGHDFAPIARAGWDFYAGAGAQDDATRLGLLVALSGRLVEQVMVMVARKRRGDGDERLSPLVMPALPVATALQAVIEAAAMETAGKAEHPRSGLREVVTTLRSVADLLESMAPPAAPPATG